MKRLLAIFLILILSCEKKDGEQDLIKLFNSPLTHAKLDFELEEPDVILNDIAKGQLENSINSILLLMYGNTERKWKFEYFDNSNIISKMIFYLPHYRGCEQEIFSFSYNDRDLISTVVSTRRNFCLEYEVIKTYTFNYNDRGLLKSIFMDNESFVAENYFGYYPNGKIKEIYTDHRGRGVEPNFGVQKFTYDESFTNVIKHESIVSNSHYTYKYSYDNNVNPFKDVFIASSVFMPFIGPAYLSENNVIEMIEKNEKNIHNQEFTTEYIYNYSATNSLIKFSYSDNERIYTINE